MTDPRPARHSVRRRQCKHCPGHTTSNYGVCSACAMKRRTYSDGLTDAQRDDIAGIVRRAERPVELTPARAASLIGLDACSHGVVVR